MVGADDRVQKPIRLANKVQMWSSGDSAECRLFQRMLEDVDLWKIWNSR